MATGHAAGVCAALATRGGVATHDVPAADVQHELRRQGADLGRGGARLYSNATGKASS